MRQSLVVGNWKMHGSRASNAELIEGVLAGLNGLEGVKVAVAPPAPYLMRVAGALADSAIAVAAQDVSEFASGAYTGEMSAAMLVDVGCDFVIVGHSERRQMFGDTEQRVAQKVRAALAGGLSPILCVGETLAEHEAGQTHSVVSSQLISVLDGLSGDELKRLVVAYEPVWAIGTGKTATPAHAQSVHASIREIVAVKSVEHAESLSILYGGSVKATNAAELFAEPDIDGALVGGASLKADEFVAICRAAAIKG